MKPEREKQQKVLKRQPASNISGRRSIYDDRGAWQPLQKYHSGQSSTIQNGQPTDHKRERKTEKDHERVREKNSVCGEP